MADQIEREHHLASASDRARQQGWVPPGLAMGRFRAARRSCGVLRPERPPAQNGIGTGEQRLDRGHLVNQDRGRRRCAVLPRASATG
jgi:hypothetical protein